MPVDVVDTIFEEAGPVEGGNLVQVGDDFVEGVGSTRGTPDLSFCRKIARKSWRLLRSLVSLRRVVSTSSAGYREYLALTAAQTDATSGRAWRGGDGEVVLVDVDAVAALWEGVAVGGE